MVGTARALYMSNTSYVTVNLVKIPETRYDAPFQRGFYVLSPCDFHFGFLILWITWNFLILDNFLTTCLLGKQTKQKQCNPYDLIKSGKWASVIGPYYGPNPDKSPQSPLSPFGNNITTSVKWSIILLGVWNSNSAACVFDQQRSSAKGSLCRYKLFRCV